MAEELYFSGSQTGGFTASARNPFPVSASRDYETVAASQTAQALGATGAKGDFLSGVLVVPATTSPGNPGSIAQAGAGTSTPASSQQPQADGSGSKNGKNGCGFSKKRELPPQHWLCSQWLSNCGL